VLHDVLESRAGNRGAYSASTAIAMPIPPPMHNDATP
jgi:hypothetical protein